MVLASVDLSQYKGQYSKLAEKMNEVGAAETRAGVAAQNMDALTQVSFRDVNLDAKTYAHLFPWGTGSLNSIEKCVDSNTYGKQLMHDFTSKFRNCEMWAALQQDRKLKLHLHNHNSFVNRPDEKAKETLMATKRFSRDLGKRVPKEVAEKGTNRQRAYYAHNFGTSVRTTRMSACRK